MQRTILARYPNIYYRADKIKANKAWVLTGIFADEGISGTSTRNRPAFNEMMQQCKQSKIDIILTQSIATFARNTVDSLNYVRALKELGIAIIFERFEDTHFRNGVIKRPTSKPRGPRKPKKT